MNSILSFIITIIYRSESPTEIYNDIIIIDRNIIVGIVVFGEREK